MGYGANEMAKVIQEIMNRNMSHLSTPILGTIQNNGLKVDGFPSVFSDYLVSEHLMLPSNIMGSTPSGEGNHPHGPSGDHEQEEGDGRHTHPSTEGSHTHTIPTPRQLRPLAPGDRVLCIPINQGNDYVVIGRVVPNA
ncbi:hypothetical protein ACERJO_11795 [Halalkalibacter sp. AB-rgal2]|uniref:hypothetical protein n=1 Tax=Halalkalibacter sp. AB-rgal2 TaxID=3242695 RepID=UPI00359CDB34